MIRKNFFYITPLFAAWGWFAIVCILSLIDGQWIAPVPVLIFLLVAMVLLSAALIFFLRRENDSRGRKNPEELRARPHSRRLAIWFWSGLLVLFLIHVALILTGWWFEWAVVMSTLTVTWIGVFITLHARS